MVKSKEQKLNLIFQALADTTRRKILKTLSSHEKAISEVAKPFDMSLAAVSKHIKVLERAELVERRWEGSFSYVRLNPKAIRTADEWIDFYRHFWEQSLDRLEIFLKEEGQNEEKL
jgi:DNA-binding transcriptional ArsR family regulator